MLIKMYIVQPIFRGLQATLGGVGGIGGGFASLFSFGGSKADGGLINGPGGPRTDSILARVSAGEFIVNAASTRQHFDLLTAINRAPGFASGGIPMPSNVSPMRGGSGVSAPTIRNEVHVHGATNPQNVRTEQVTDGRGNIRTDVYLDNAVAAALSRSGSASQGAMRNTYGARKSAVKR